MKKSRPPETIASIGEEGFLKLLAGKLPARLPGVEIGFGDDAAVIKNEKDFRIVITTDTLVAGVHFLPELEEPYLRYLEEIENQVSVYLSPRIDPIKIRRLACAVAGFVFGFFSFATIGMTPDEIETSITPLRRVFVRSLCIFLGR